MSRLSNAMKALIEGLTQEQQEAVLFPASGRLRISAGAGSGKTEVLTRRIDGLLKQGIKPTELVAITYTQKAASEMKTRLTEKRKLPSSVLRSMEVSTFHSFLNKFLKLDPFGAGIDSSITTIEANTREILLLDLAERFAEQYGDRIINGERALGPELADKLIKEFPNALSKIRRYLLGPGEFYRKAKQALETREPKATELEFKTLEWLFIFYSIYMEEIEKRNLIDFDEILIRSQNLVKEMRDSGILPERRVFLIDEFQDNNPNQFGIVEEFCRDRESQICVVGDEKQSIYRFQGANVDTFRGFTSDQDIILKDNFRSYAEVINLADSFLEKSGDIGKMFVKQEARRGNSPRYPAISCLLTPDEMPLPIISQQLAEFIRDTVASGMTIPDRKNGGEMRPIRYGDIAIILSSVKNLPSDFEDALSALQIPYVMSGGFGLYDRSEIAELLAFLKILVQPNDDFSVVKILTGPLYGLNDSDLTKLSIEGKFENVNLLPRILAMKEEDLPEEARNFRTLYISLKERANKPGLVNLCHTIIEQAGFYEYSATQKSELKRRRMNNNIAKFIGIVRNFEQNGVFTSLRDFLKQVERTRSADIDEDEAGLGLDDGDAVKIMTIHKSKGLEFPLVIVPFLKSHQNRSSEKIVYDDQFGLIVNENTSKLASPAYGAYKEREKNEAASEEFRKLYVAFTRAEDLLVITGALKHSIPPEDIDKPITEPICHVRQIIEANPAIGKVMTINEWPYLLNQWLEAGKGEPVKASEQVTVKPDIDMLENGIKAIGSFLEARGNAISTIQDNEKDIFSLQELALFKECPRKYYFASVHAGSFEERTERFPTLVGKLAHETIRLFHENEGHKIASSKEAIDLAESLLDKLIPCYAGSKSMPDDGEEKMTLKELKARTMLLLNRYVESDLSKQEPWMFEAEVNVKFDSSKETKPFFIRGFADRVDKDEGGSVRIIDFKTREYSEAAHEGYKRQLALYRIASNRGILGETGCLNFPSSYIAYLNPKGLDLREIEPDLEGFDEEAAKVVAAIRKEHNWYAKITKHCNQCPFRMLCNKK